MANIVSERYALSLYEVAKEQGKAQAYFDELAAVRDVFTANPDFLKVLTTPSIDAAHKRTVLKNVFEGRVEQLMLNFLLLITDKGRIGLIADMYQSFQELYYFENGIVEVHAVTARPMSDALQTKLREKMAVVTGKKVVLKQSVDPSLIGGIVVKVDNKQFDTSLHTKLLELSQQLTNTIA